MAASAASSAMIRNDQMSIDRILLCCLGLIAVSLSLAGCSQNNPPETDQTRILKENAMQVSKNETASPSVPPIDAAAPEEFQTASFGLG